MNIIWMGGNSVILLPENINPIKNCKYQLQEFKNFFRKLCHIVKATSVASWNLHSYGALYNSKDSAIIICHVVFHVHSVLYQPLW